MFYGLLFVAVLMPVDSVRLDREHASITTYRDQIYIAPFIGRSLTVMSKKEGSDRIILTDKPADPIYDMAATSFAIYLNNGRSIDKAYLASGHRELIYRARDISAFTLTAAEEVVFANRYDKTLVFLDSGNHEKFTITDINVQDIVWTENVLYALTPAEIMIIDEHGNILRRIDKPVKCDRLVATDSLIITYCVGDNSIFMLKETWCQIPLTHHVIDITPYEDHILMLGGGGRVLYYYRYSDF